MMLRRLLRHLQGVERVWPRYIPGGRVRTSTIGLIAAFVALFWLYQIYDPPARPPEVPAQQIVPPGFVPDPEYTWVPRTQVQPPTSRRTTTTTTPTTTSPTETTTTEPTETTEETSPSSPTPRTTVVDPDGFGPLPPQTQTVVTVTPTPPSAPGPLPGPAPASPTPPPR